MYLHSNVALPIHITILGKYLIFSTLETTLTRRTRQGCPLSPLLFTMVTEPLSACVQNSINIQGLRFDTYERKMSLYVDDILLYITDPENSISHLLKTIKEFGTYSGTYKIHFNKSNALFLHMTPTEKILTSCGFNCTPKGFKYLGRTITPELYKLFKENYTPLTFKVKSETVKVVFPAIVTLRHN